jgi:hypothetical protein
MKKIYENIEIGVIFLTEDVVRTSQNDNVTDMPEFPENFQP